MASLFNLDAEFMRLRAMAEEGDLDPEALADTYEGLEDEWLDKMDASVYVIKLLEASAKVLDDDIKDLTARKKSIENNILTIKDRMFKSIKLRYPGEKSKPENKKRFGYWTQFSAKSLATYNTEEIPQDYFIPQPAKLDTEKLTKDMRELDNQGKPLPYGVTLKQTESLRWR